MNRGLLAWSCSSKSSTSSLASSISNLRVSCGSVAAWKNSVRPPVAALAFEWAVAQGRDLNPPSGATAGQLFCSAVGLGA